MRRHLPSLGLAGLLAATGGVIVWGLAPPAAVPTPRVSVEAAAAPASAPAAVDPLTASHRRDPREPRAAAPARTIQLGGHVTPEAPEDIAHLLAELDRYATMDHKSSEGRTLSATLVDGMAELARRDPAAAAQLADALVQRAARGEDIRLISAALGGARTPEATDALASTLDRIEGFDRKSVMGVLGIAPTPTVSSLDTLDGMREGRYERSAAMAMGGQIHALAEQDPDAAARAAARLVTGYETADSAMERRAYAIALGNAGDRAGLPAVLDMLAHEPSQTEIALLALRYMPGDDVDTTLAGYLGAPGPHATAAIRSVSQRDAARWTPVLERLRAAYSAAGLEGDRAVQLIDDALLRWSRQG